MTLGWGGAALAKTGLFRKRLKYNVKVFKKNNFSKTKNMLFFFKCGNKRILPKYFDLFDIKVQQDILVGLLNAPKLLILNRSYA